MTRLEKIMNNLDADTIEVMQAFDVNALKNLVVQSEQTITATKQDLEDSPQYQEAKENIKALSSGYKELKKRQTAKIQYALILLTEKGE